MRYLCPYCEDYDTAGHNYCRICGSHLKAGKPVGAEVPQPYIPREKFCGYCGRQREKCAGLHRNKEGKP